MNEIATELYEVNRRRNLGQSLTVSWAPIKLTQYGSYLMRFWQTAVLQQDAGNQLSRHTSGTPIDGWFLLNVSRSEVCRTHKR